MSGVIWLPYGVQHTLQMPLLKADGSGFAESGDWTPADGGESDAQLSKDGAGFVDATNLPVFQDRGCWGWTLTAAELENATVYGSLKDVTGGLILEDAVLIHTLGDADALFPLPGQGTQPEVLADMVKISGDSTAADNLELIADGTGLATFASQIRNASALITGVAASATATTMVLQATASVTALADDDLIGWVVAVIHGSGAIEHNRITDYVASTRTITVSGWRVQTPDTTSVYALMPGKL